MKRRDNYKHYKPINHIEIETQTCTDKCKQGCIYYRRIDGGVVGGYKVCHYITCTGHMRNSNPASCDKFLSKKAVK